jgi:hypothetical protein
MALLRNREVTVLGPIDGSNASPTYTVQYADGTREDTPLKFVQMSESEHKKWAKDNAPVADHVKVIADKDHQEVVDSQNVEKIKKEQAKHPHDDKPVAAKTYVKPSEVKQA